MINKKIQATLAITILSILVLSQISYAMQIVEKGESIQTAQNAQDEKANNALNLLNQQEDTNDEEILPGESYDISNELIKTTGKEHEEGTDKFLLKDLFVNKAEQETAKIIESQSTESRNRQVSKQDDKTISVSSSGGQTTGGVIGGALNSPAGQQNILGGGLTRQQFNTDLFTGSVSYSYLFNVPEGINNLAPLIGIFYNHYRAGTIQSVVGSGWTLAENEIYRDINYTRSNARDDFFKLRFNGADSKLVFVPSENRYHTETESFLWIEKRSGGENEKGEYWLVKTKDGTTYRFGYNKDSEFVSDSEPYVTKWSLDLAEDTHGNKIIYQYKENQEGEKAVYLDKISYNENKTIIRFNYELNVLPRLTYYSQGIASLQTGILKNVNITNGGILTKAYSFDYKQTGTKQLLQAIHEIGNDGVSELPPVRFDYYEPAIGWKEQSEYAKPSDISFNSQKDEGIRIFDVDGDGLDDIVNAKGTNVVSYWKNAGNGWAQKQTIQTSLTNGFVDSDNRDSGVRLADVNGDGRTDLIQLTAGINAIKKVLINTGNSWQEQGYSIPAEIGFTKKLILQTNCEPQQCPSDSEDLGVSCSGTTCTRNCKRTSCNWGSSRVVFDKQDFYYKHPYWSGKWYEESDQGDAFVPTSNQKCYKFEFTGSPKENGYISKCFTLESDDTYDECWFDSQGNSVTVYGGIGFTGNRNDSSWLTTIPPGSNNGYIDNGFGKLYQWNGRYYTKIEYDDEPEYHRYMPDPPRNICLWSKLKNIVCHDAGTQTIFCAPNRKACDASVDSNCGYGCVNEPTSPFVIMGFYRDHYGNILDALEDKSPKGWDRFLYRMRYLGYNKYKVTEYDTSSSLTSYGCQFVPYYTTSNPISTIDLNGDGKTDLIKTTPTEQKAWINTGSGFVEDSSWTLPWYFTSDGKDIKIRSVDLNGDGLLDIVKEDGSYSRYPAINTGKGWGDSGGFLIPEDAAFVINGEDQGVTFMDVNADGLPDLVKSKNNAVRVWLNTGNGWREETPSAFSPVLGDFSSFATQLVDLDGDGYLDVMRQDSTSAKSWMSTLSGNHLLKQVSNGFGWAIRIDYKKISSLNNLGSDGISDFSGKGYVAYSITKENGMSDQQAVSSTTLYNYSGAMFEPNSKEFRGFAFVEETLSDNSKARHWFYQDGAKKGVEYKTELLNENNILQQRTEQILESRQKDGYTIIQIGSQISFLFEGKEFPLIQQTNYTYDDYGNIKAIINYGDLSKKGDELYTSYEYVYALDKWIISAIKDASAFDANKTKLRQTQYAYDAQEIGASPLKGDLTKTIYWLKEGVSPWEGYGYDSYGNKINYTNQLGDVTFYYYDSSHRFVEKMQNALSQNYTYIYDIFDNLVTEKDANGFATSYSYDTFGRQVRETRPCDIESYRPRTICTQPVGQICPQSVLYYPTRELIYNFTTIPIKVTTKLRETPFKISDENSGTSLDSYEYYDGFGNLIQTKKESESSQFITKDFVYDKQGRIINESNPYYTQSFEYNSPTSAPSAEFKYDIFGRVIEIINPDKTKQRAEYEKLNVTIFDENNNKIRRIYDIYGRIVEVYEYNGNEVYATRYLYLPTGELIEIKNNQNNLVKYEYDSLGRKTNLQDPDLGNWNYGYDAMGNLIKQEDANGDIISLKYDALGRIISKNSMQNVNSISYVYDNGTIGTLSKVEMPDYVVSYAYDERLRPVKEEKTIDGKKFIISFEYDSLDRITSKTLPDSTKIEYLYNNQGSLGSIDDIISFGYNEHGQTTTRSMKNKLITNFWYEPLTFKLKNITTGSLQSKDYSYDNVGNIIEINDNKNNKTESFSYDNLSRLIHAEKSGNSKNEYNLVYTYDSIGNMLNLNAPDYYLKFIYGASVAHAPSLVESSSSILNLQSKSSELVAHFGFGKAFVLSENNTINKIKDQAGGYSGNAMGGVSLIEDGINKEAINFNGINGTVVVSSDEFLDLGKSDLTISLWIKGPFAPNQKVLSTKNVDTLSQGYGLYAFSQDQIVLKVGNGTEASYLGVNGLGDRKWHNVVFLISRNGTSLAYRDGILAFTSQKKFFAEQDIKNSEGLYIGSNIGKNWFFGGSLDELMIWRKALSKKEVADLYSKQKSALFSAPLLKMQFDSSNAFSSETNKIGAFNGVDNYIRINQSDFLQFNELTIGGWFKTNTFTSGKNEITGSWISKRNSFILHPWTDGKVSFYAFISNGWYRVDAPAENKIELGRWEHWAASYDGKEMKLYKNGILIAKKYVQGTIGNSSELCVGHDCYPDGSKNNRYFNGKADEIQVYNVLLSEASISALYSQQKNNFYPDLIEAYNFNEGFSSYAREHTLPSILGNVSLKTISGNNKAASFDGKTSYLRVNNFTLPQFSEVTIGGWFKTNTFTSGKNEITGSWISKRNSFILHPWTDGKVSFYAFISNGWYHVDAPAENKIELGRWEHWAASYDGKEMKLYKNGQLIASKKVYGRLGNSGDICIGSDCGVANRFFNGSADELMVYKKAILPQEVNDLYVMQKATILTI